jgi:hypothetical protein
VSTFADYAEKPLEFCELHLQQKFAPPLRVLFHQLMTDHRAGLTHRRNTPESMRRFEVCVVLWHMLCRPQEDVVLMLNNGPSWKNWMRDCAAVIAGASVQVREECAVDNDIIYTRFLGSGRLHPWVCHGQHARVPTEINGATPLFVISDINLMPHDDMQLCFKAQSTRGGRCVVSSYA